MNKNLKYSPTNTSYTGEGDYLISLFNILWNTSFSNFYNITTDFMGKQVSVPALVTQATLSSPMQIFVKSY